MRTSMIKLPDSPQRQKIAKDLGYPDNTPFYLADYKLPLRVTKADVTTGVKKDPAECAFARAACRMYGVAAVKIGRRIAYVPQMIGEQDAIVKFQVSNGGSKRLRGFDRTGHMAENQVFLLPMPLSWDPTAMAVSNSRLRQNQKNGAVPKKSKKQRRVFTDIRAPLGVL